MPPRKKRAMNAAGPSQPPQPVNSHFISEVHAKRFDDVMRKRSEVRERGFQLCQDEYPEIQEEIARRNWKVFCTHPSTGRLNTFREFYANAFRVDEEAPRFISSVRGVQIGFSARVLNTFFGTRPADPFGCQYRARIGRDVRPDEIVRDLCREGAEWILDRQGNPRYLKKSDFKPIPKAWCTFVQSRLMPSLNKSEVTVKRALLVHIIITGGDIDVGGIIADNIELVANESSGSLWYPSLITRMCRNEGGCIEHDIVIPVEPPIDAAYIDRLHREFAQAHPEGAQPLPQPHPEPIPQPTPIQQQPIPSSTDFLQQLAAEHQQIIKHQRQLHDQQTIMLGKIQRSAKKHDYLIQAHIGIEGMIRNLA